MQGGAEGKREDELSKVKVPTSAGCCYYRYACFCFWPGREPAESWWMVLGFFLGLFPGFAFAYGLSDWIYFQSTGDDTSFGVAANAGVCPPGMSQVTCSWYTLLVNVIGPFIGGVIWAFFARLFYRYVVRLYGFCSVPSVATLVSTPFGFLLALTSVANDDEDFIANSQQAFDIGTTFAIVPVIFAFAPYLIWRYVFCCKPKLRALPEFQDQTQQQKQQEKAASSLVPITSPSDEIDRLLRILLDDSYAEFWLEITTVEVTQILRVTRITLVTVTFTTITTSSNGRRRSSSSSGGSSGSVGKRQRRRRTSLRWRLRDVQPFQPLPPRQPSDSGKFHALKVCSNLKLVGTVIRGLALASGVPELIPLLNILETGKRARKLMVDHGYGVSEAFSAAVAHEVHLAKQGMARWVLPVLTGVIPDPSSLYMALTAARLGFANRDLQVALASGKSPAAALRGVLAKHPGLWMGLASIDWADVLEQPSDAPRVNAELTEAQLWQRLGDAGEAVAPTVKRGRLDAAAAFNASMHLYAVVGIAEEMNRAQSLAQQLVDTESRGAEETPSSRVSLGHYQVAFPESDEVIQQVQTLISPDQLPAAEQAILLPDSHAIFTVRVQAHLLQAAALRDAWMKRHAGAGEPPPLRVPDSVNDSDLAQITRAAKVISEVSQLLSAAPTMMNLLRFIAAMLELDPSYDTPATGQAYHRLLQRARQDGEFLHAAVGTALDPTPLAASAAATLGDVVWPGTRANLQGLLLWMSDRATALAHATSPERAAGSAKFIGHNTKLSGIRVGPVDVARGFVAHAKDPDTMAGVTGDPRLRMLLAHLVLHASRNNGQVDPAMVGRDVLQQRVEPTQIMDDVAAELETIRANVWPITDESANNADQIQRIGAVFGHHVPDGLAPR